MKILDQETPDDYLGLSPDTIIARQADITEAIEKKFDDVDPEEYVKDFEKIYGPGLLENITPTKKLENKKP